MAKWKALKRLYNRLQDERAADSLDRFLTGLMSHRALRRELESLSREQLTQLRLRGKRQR